MTALIIMRHGQTTWARENRFAGWADAPLSKPGKEEARRAGLCLAKADLQFDFCYTSNLSRASMSLVIALEAMRHRPVPVEADWRLNERHYGALQGRSRLDALSEFGNAQVLRWRRGFDDRPPPLQDEDARLPGRDPNHVVVKQEERPATESMRDAVLRVVPLWETRIAPQIRTGKRILVVAHTSSIRGLTRLLEDLDDAECETFSIPTAVPVRYELSNDLKVIERTDLFVDLASQLRVFVTRHKPKAAVSWI